MYGQVLKVCKSVYMYRYKVKENILITPSVRLLTLSPFSASQKQLLYRPGQYAAISLHDHKRPTTTRCFSLVSSPTRGSDIQFSIRVKGKYTSALERLEQGDRVDVRGAFGLFVFNEQEQHDLVFFAGGIGIAPFIGMLRYAADVQTQQNIHLVYSTRNKTDIAFLPELIALEEKLPKLRVTYVLGEGGEQGMEGLHVFQGRVDETIVNDLDLVGGTRQKKYMLCGPPPYMDALFALLKKQGVPKRYIQSESFSQNTEKQTETRIHWPANAYALSGLTFAVFAGLIAVNDLNKTLPKLEGQYNAPEEDRNAIATQDTSLLAKVRTVPPQVDTDLSQEPFYEYIENDEIVVVTEPAVATQEQQQVVTTPTVATPEPVVIKKKIIVEPTPTTIVQEPPRTTVS